MKNFAWVLALSMTMPLFSASAQEAEKVEEPAGYQFTDTKVLPTTPIIRLTICRSVSATLQLSTL